MTYGWALLAIFIALAVLGILVLDPQRFLANSCALAPPLHCEDAVASSAAGTITLFIRNGLAEDITLLALDLPDAGCSSDINVEIPHGDARSATMTCGTPSSRRLSSALLVTYDKHRLDGITVTRSGWGNLAITYEGPAAEGGGQAPEGGGGDQGICQNAQAGDLCGGLDILFGDGFQAECCSAYGLCC